MDVFHAGDAQEIAEASAGTVASALQLLRQGKLSEQTVRQALSLHREILGPAAAARDDFQQSSERTFVVLARNRKVEAVIQRFREKKIDEIALLKELTGLSKQYPDYAKLRNLIQRFADPQERVLLARFDAGVKTADPAVAEEAMGGLRRLWEVLTPSNASNRIASLEKNLEAARTERMLRDVRASFAAKNYEKAVEAGQEVLKRPIDETARAVVQTLMGDAQSGLATQRWLWMRSLDRRYIDARITPEEAEQTIRYYPQVSAHLSRKTYPSVDDDLLFYQAMAFRRIGQNDKADQNFRQLLEKYPKSAYVHWVKHYQQGETVKSAKDSAKEAAAGSAGDKKVVGQQR
jgi:tetratricopeptide (TPR) repeat protein